MNQTEILVYTILGATGAAGIAYTLNKTHKAHKGHQKHNGDKKYKEGDNNYGTDFKSATAGENSQKIKLDSDDAELRDAEYHLKKAEKELLETKTFKERFEASEKVDKLQKKFDKVSSLKYRSIKAGSLNKKTRNKRRK